MEQTASHPRQYETSFCNDKGTTCLTNPATQVTVSRVLYDTKITAEKRLAGKCATLLFEGRHPINRRYKHPKFVGLRYVGYVIE